MRAIVLYSQYSVEKNPCGHARSGEETSNLQLWSSPNVFGRYIYMCKEVGIRISRRSPEM